MSLSLARNACLCTSTLSRSRISHRHYSEDRRADSKDDKVSPRLGGLGHTIEDEYAAIRDNYGNTQSTSVRVPADFGNRSATPKNPIVLAHGLLGFDELHIAGSWFPGIQYWRGITDALRANGIEVITASVPASASIEQRAERLSNDIYKKAQGKSVNIIAYVPITLEQLVH